MCQSAIRLLVMFLAGTGRCLINMQRVKKRKRNVLFSCQLLWLCTVKHKRTRTGLAQTVQRLTKGWTVQGSNPCEDEIFRTCPDLPRQVLWDMTPCRWARRSRCLTFHSRLDPQDERTMTHGKVVYCWPKDIELCPTRPRVLGTTVVITSTS